MPLTEETQVVVLLGGLGTRLKDTAADTPKSMVDVHGRPFFHYQLHLMKQQGFRDFVFCVGYMGEAIEDYFADGSEYGVNIRYSYDGDGLLGTGGALRKALPLLDPDFVVIYGDSYMDTDYRELIYRYLAAKSRGKKALMSVYRNADKYDRSNVVFKNDELLEHDKWRHAPEMEYIDFGVSILNKSVVEAIPEGQELDLSDVYQQLVHDRLMSGCEVANRFYEIGRPDSLDEFRRFIHERAMVKKPAVFLDRDGTLNEIVYNEDTEQPDSPLSPGQLKLLPGSIDALKTLRSLGYTLIVITNQPAAAKGKTTLGNLYDVNKRFRDILAGEGVQLDDILICPHHPVGAPACRETYLIRECDCRKPGAGLLKRGIEKFNVDVEKSYIVGDSSADILAGKAAGLKTVYIGVYNCGSRQLLDGQEPDLVFDSVYDFAERLRNSKGAAG